MKKNFKNIILSMVAMGLVILLSNELVQHPVQGVLLGVDLSLVLTWGAFTYPIAFLVTDATNKLFGPESARRVVAVGFVVGVGLTLIAALAIAFGVAGPTKVPIWQALFQDPDAFAMVRIAIASGSAFLVAQLLDIKIFDVLRAKEWWKAPVASSLLASTVDTYIFFSIAFLGSGLPWVTWAVGDLCVKVSMVGLLLYPFRMLTWRGRDISRSCSVDSTSQSGQF
jgi:hypothetical protein